MGGLEGTILGAFYGPAAEEAGGVLSGSDATSATERHLLGYFRGDRLESTVPEGVLAVSSAAVHRDFAASAVESSDAAVTAVASDGVGGYRVTYRVDGAERTVHLEARDYGSSVRCATCYHQRMDDRSWVFWDPGSYARVPEFDYFDVAAWAVTDWRDAGHTEASIAGERRGFVVYGSPTETLPAGTASYEGRAYAEIRPRDDPARAARRVARGRLALTADFGAGTVGGAIEEIEVQGPGQSAYGKRVA